MSTTGCYPVIAHDDPVIAPRAILLGHADDQRLQLLGNHGATGSLALCGAIKLLGHELAVPTENGVGLDDRRHFRQRLLAQLLADVGEGPCARHRSSVHDL